MVDVASIRENSLVNGGDKTILDVSLVECIYYMHAFPT